MSNGHGRLVAVLLVALLLAGCGGGDPFAQDGAGQTADGGQAGPVVIGSTNFPEQLILGNMYAEALRARGVEVRTRLNLGSREIVFPALEAGELDLLPEYTGALLNFLTDGQTEARSSEEVVVALREQLPEGIVALEPAPAQDKDVWVVTPETAQRHGLQSLGDLAPVAGDLVLGGPPEAPERFVGLRGLKEVYGVEFKEFRALDAGGPLTVGALENGDVDVANLFSTQAVIEEKGWVALEDPKNLVPAEHIIPVLREEKLTDTIREVLNDLSAKLTTDELRALNERVEIDREDPEEVARDWLRRNGFLE